MSLFNNNPPFIVLINGPPGSGKDHLGKVLQNRSNFVIRKFAEHLKRSTHVDLGLPYDMPVDFFEDTKDTPNEIFFGKSPREGYISKSETQIKPVYGDEFYGTILLRLLARDCEFGLNKIAITDSGFDKEVNPLLREINPANFLLLRIHEEERGKTFSNDSRSYIYIDSIESYDINNQLEGRTDLFENHCIALVNSWLNKKGKT